MRFRNSVPGKGAGSDHREIRVSTQAGGEGPSPSPDLEPTLPAQAPAPVAWPVPPLLGDELTRGLARLVEAGSVMVNRDAEDHILAIELTRKDDPSCRTKYRFDSERRLLEYQHNSGGVPESEESYRFDGSGKCIAWSKSRYDGAWDWWGEVKFDDAGNVVDSRGVLAKEMTKQPSFAATDLLSVVTNLVSNPPTGVRGQG